MIHWGIIYTHVYIRLCVHFKCTQNEYEQPSNHQYQHREYSHVATSISIQSISIALETFIASKIQFPQFFVPSTLIGIL